jgi:hypothetical protein
MQVTRSSDRVCGTVVAWTARRDAGCDHERRTPGINGNGGRDHWTFCYSVMFAGAGIKGGTIAVPPTPKPPTSRTAQSLRRISARRSTSAWESTPT